MSPGCAKPPKIKNMLTENLVNFSVLRAELRLGAKIEKFAVKKIVVKFGVSSVCRRLLLEKTIEKPH